MLPPYIQQVRLTWGEHNLAFYGRDTHPDAKHIVTSLNGWWGGVGTKGEDLTLLGHGSYISDRKRESRAITLEATMIYRSDEERRVASRYVSGVLGSGASGTLTTDADGVTLSTEVFLEGSVSHEFVGQNAIRVQIPMTAPDPRLYAEPRTYQLYPAGFGEGLEYPPFSTDGVLTYGNSVPTSKIAIKNNGNFEAFPKFIIKGTFPSGIRLTEGSRVVEFPVAIFPQTPVVVDMRGSVTLRGDDQSYLLTRRDWFSAPPGGTIQPRITALQQGDGWADVELSDTYI